MKGAWDPSQRFCSSYKVIVRDSWVYCIRFPNLIYHSPGLNVPNLPLFSSPVFQVLPTSFTTKVLQPTAGSKCLLRCSGLNAESPFPGPLGQLAPSEGHCVMALCRLSLLKLFLHGISLVFLKSLPPPTHPSICSFIHPSTGPFHPSLHPWIQ